MWHAATEFRRAIGAADGSHAVRYVREPIGRKPDFDAESVNYPLDALWERGEMPK